MHVRLPSSSTKDVFDFENTPSLVGFWPGDIDSQSRVIDYSKYGHHLSYESVAGIPFSAVTTEIPGFLALRFARLYCNLTSQLDSGARAVVATCEFYRPAGNLTDADCGTSNDFPGYYTANTYRGFMVGGHNNELYSRVTSLSPTTQTQGTPVVISDDTPATISMGYTPGGNLLQCVDDGSVETVDASTVANPLVAQSNVFALQSNGNYFGMRNYQLWVFDSMPSNIEMTLQWLALSPGKIPPWWMGL